MLENLSMACHIQDTQKQDITSLPTSLISLCISSIRITFNLLVWVHQQ